jgi:hypothetical protein
MSSRCASSICAHFLSADLAQIAPPRLDLISDRGRRSATECDLSIRLLCRLTSLIMTSSQPAAYGYVMDEPPITTGEKPRAEPEIIPPDSDDRQSKSSTARIRVFVDESGTRHVYVTRLWLLGILLLALTIGILFAIILVLVLGAFLIWIPLVGLLVAAAIISGLLRAFFRKPR